MRRALCEGGGKRPLPRNEGDDYYVIGLGHSAEPGGSDHCPAMKGMFEIGTHVEVTNHLGGKRPLPRNEGDVPPTSGFTPKPLQGGSDHCPAMKGMRAASSAVADISLGGKRPLPRNEGDRF